MKRLDLHISERARQFIAKLLSRAPEGSLPVLMRASTTIKDKDGTVIDEEPERWLLNVYGKEQAELLERDHAVHGRNVIFETANGPLCVPQGHLIKEIQGKQLDVEGHNVSIT